MKELKECLLEITNHLEQELIPFWGKRAVDKEYSGYFTNFDKEGILEEDKAKYIVTQTRMLWGFSKLYHTYKKEEYLIAAQQGYHFLTTYFWDKCYGGWYWKTEQNGKVSDDGKVVYGQAFAIYALSEYALAAGNREAQEYAEKTFELLQKYCADEVRGGYYENMERDFSLSADGYHGGDLKSLDVHMHVMEALTMLYQCSQKKKHAQALEKVRELILKYMINQESGCGYNQFDLSFRPKPAILIHRTWNDERKEGNRIKEPVDTTSYGHNVELIWLLNRAEEVLGKESNHFNCLTKRVFEHVCRYGYEYSLL